MDDVDDMNDVDDVDNVDDMENVIDVVDRDDVNDVEDDYDLIVDGQYADKSNFINLTKHWAELKGFALGLQFNPTSPYAAEDMRDELKQILADIGDAPVLADGSQNGVAATGTAAEAITAYRAKLVAARDAMGVAYGFDASDVENW